MALDEGAFEADRAATGYRLAVAVGDPAHAEQLLRTAADVVRADGGDLVAVTVVETRRASPTAVFPDDVVSRKFAAERRAALDRVIESAADLDVPVSGDLVVGRDVSRALRRAVTDNDCDGVLLGWRDRSRTDAVLGRNVDRIVTRAPCDVLVERVGDTADGVDAVLLPAGEGANGDLAAAVADAVATANDARIDVVRAVAPDDDRETARRLVDATAAGLDAPAVETRILSAPDPADALVDATADYDFAAVGATEAGWLRRLVAGSVAREVCTDAACPVVLARREPGAPRVRTWLQRRVG